MKVILLAEVRGLGWKDDVKEVADGYFRNVLLPKKLAVAATDSALAELRQRQARAAAQKEKLLAEIKSKIPAIQNLVLIFRVKTGEKDEIFGSVTKKDIQIALSEKGFKNLSVDLEHPIKALGEREVAVDLGEGVRARVKVLVEK